MLWGGCAMRGTGVVPLKGAPMLNGKKNLRRLVAGYGIRISERYLG